MRRLVALVLYGIAAGAAFGWWLHATTTTCLGLTAAGLFFQAAGGLGPARAIAPPEPDDDE